MYRHNICVRVVDTYNTITYSILWWTLHEKIKPPSYFCLTKQRRGFRRPPLCLQQNAHRGQLHHAAEDLAQNHWQSEGLGQEMRRVFEFFSFGIIHLWYYSSLGCVILILVFQWTWYTKSFGIHHWDVLRNTQQNHWVFNSIHPTNIEIFFWYSSLIHNLVFIGMFRLLWFVWDVWGFLGIIPPRGSHHWHGEGYTTVKDSLWSFKSLLWFASPLEMRRNTPQKRPS